MSDKCNGWSNYETWLVNLWISDGELFREDIPRFTDHYDLAEYIKEYFKEFVPPENTGVYADLIMSALNRVN